MVNINETIAEVEKLNPELARQIRKYVHDHSYGLVFENNLPEAVRLYTKNAAMNDTVNIRPPRGKNETSENRKAWNVMAINDGMATIENGKDKRQVTTEDLVPIVSYRDIIYPGLHEVDRIERGGKNDPYQVVINAENYHALELLAYCYAGKVDCIYIDPPYNTGAKDWKYNNDYVDATDQYRHSKWLAFMERRLKLAKDLLNPKDSVLIVTIDEKEYLRLGLLLEQIFPSASITMATDVINPRAGVVRPKSFTRTQEYIFFVQIGDAKVTPEVVEPSDGTRKHPIWFSLMRTGQNSARTARPNLFYPIWVDKKTKKFYSIGDNIAVNIDKETVQPPNNDVMAIWPLRPDGRENTWQLGRETLSKAFAEGTARISTHGDKVTVNYLRNAEKKRIESGEITVLGKDENGALILQRNKNAVKTKAPDSVWIKSSHDAGIYGSTLLNDIFHESRFSFPKSVYAVHDAIRYFVADKPDALVVDFFAGSGTTLHAVNLLNAEDGGHRRCICVTNNEVSADEQATFIKKGLRPGDKEWEARGIARYVTWPRTKCIIEGVDVTGKPLKGNYLGTDMEMSDGFKANAIFFDLTYESEWPIRLDRAFNAIAPILWMKAGCRGPIIQRVGKSYLTTDYYGVLFDYGQASKFVQAVRKHPNIQNAFVVTDDQRRYSNMCRRLPGIEVTRLYESFLKTFEIYGEGGRD